MPGDTSQKWPFVYPWLIHQGGTVICLACDLTYNSQTRNGVARRLKQHAACGHVPRSAEIAFLAPLPLARA